MKRREFMTLIGSAFAWPLAARAQQAANVTRIGFLGLFSASSHATRVEALRAGLRDFGYVEGQNILLEFRWAEGDFDRLPALAAELVGLNVDVLVTHATPGALAAKQATKTIPIIITAVTDVLALGLVSSLSHPGGNVTGLTFFNPELSAKRLELVKEVVPSLAKVAVLLNPDNPANRLVLLGLGRTAQALKVELHTFEAREPGDFERAFAAMATEQIGAVVLHEDTMLSANVKAIANLAASHRLPGCGFPEFAVAGGLIAYGIDYPDMDRRAATFVDKVLRGVKAANIPIEQPTKYQLAINLTTAKALGLTVPATLLARADEVIE